VIYTDKKRKQGEKMSYTIREIEEKDNPQIEQVIRTCLIEFGGNREGLAWADPILATLSKAYETETEQYWVIQDETGKIVGGAGIGKVKGLVDVCELQKMYCLPEVRGTGLSHQLMEKALTFAQKYYAKCYIETLSNMVAANKFYQKYGFQKLSKPLLKTEHYACDVWYLKELGGKV